MKISVSMMVQNEERNIERALASCEFADEIVVVDGGSTDRTMEILSKHPRVVAATVPWKGNYADQRNESLSRCSGDWIIRLDADEAFSADFEKRIRGLLSGFPSDVIGCKIRQCNLVGSEEYYSRVFDIFEWVPRIFRYRPEIRFRGTPHEWLEGLGEGRVVRINAYVVHYGFLDKARYAEKGRAYAKMPDSGFKSSEELLFREYDIQPRPASSAVGSNVPPWPAKPRESERPRVAIVRGPNLNPWEMQNYEPLAESYDITAFTTTSPRFDISKARLPVVQVPPHLEHPAYMMGLEFALFDYDLVFSADTAWIFSYQAANLCGKFGKKLVCLQWENIPFAYERLPDMQRCKAVARDAADHFIAVTERAKEALLLEGVDPMRITVIPMGVDTKLFRPDAVLRESCRAELGIGAGETVVLFTGRMVWEKGVYDFVHAASLARLKVGAEFPVRYVMVGKGPEREAVMARVREVGLDASFIFIESRPYDRMRDLYNAADLFVLPSISTRIWKEQFGMALAEAMACGVPAISTTSGSIPEVVGDAGILVPESDPTELALAIASLCVSASLREELGRKGRARALERFSSEKVAARVGDLFEKVLGESGKPRAVVALEARNGAIVKPEFLSQTEPQASSSLCVVDKASVEGGDSDRSYYRHARRDVEAMIPEGASRILDIGCGEGVLGRVLLEKGAAEVVGIEADPAAAEVARKNLTRVFQGDVETMDFPFADGYFDCIVFADVLEHMRDPLSVLKKLKIVLSDSGVVVASIPNVRFINVIDQLAKGRWEYYDCGIFDRNHLRFFTRMEMEILFSDAGFELEGISENLVPEYNSVSEGYAGDISFGRVTLRNQTREEVRDLFVFQYLLRARRTGFAANFVNVSVESALAVGDLEKAKDVLERRLMESPIDIDALMRHSDIVFRMGLKEAALEDLEKVLLFNPGNEEALRRKAVIENAVPQEK
ncbi:MAG: glycosyltransferase [Syntrophorhabdaceae bacterium]|nr:glycosyltransferase [Syntrophorhabdaceae bacterium]